MLLWQAYENRLKFFITHILSNTRFLISAKSLAFILALASVGYLFADFYCFNKELMNAGHLCYKATNLIGRAILYNSKL